MPNVYVVRQHAFVFLVFVGGGVLFCVFPWTMEEITNGIGGILTRVGLSIVGLAAVATGLFGWRAVRVGLVVDRKGIWCSGYSMFKLKLVPWDALHCLKKVTWTSLEGEHEGVLIDLKNEVNHPGGQVIANLSKPNLHTHFGIEYAIPFLVSHDEWDWQPDQFVAIALRCIEEPSARESLGEWRA